MNNLITTKTKSTCYTFLKNKNQFGKYSISIKFNKSSETDMEELREIQQQYREIAGKELYVKDQNFFVTIEISNMFDNFIVEDVDGVNFNRNNIPENIPFDSQVIVSFKVIQTKSGSFFPALNHVKIISYAEEKIKQENVEAVNKKIEKENNLSEISLIVYVRDLQKEKEVFFKNNEMYYFENQIKKSFKDNVILNRFLDILRQSNTNIVEEVKNENNDINNYSNEEVSYDNLNTFQKPTVKNSNVIELPKNHFDYEKKKKMSEEEVVKMIDEEIDLIELPNGKLVANFDDDIPF